MMQQGQVFKLASVARDGGELWAYRYRTGGRDSKRVQRGGFRNEAEARAALERALEKHRRRRGWGKGSRSPSSSTSTSRSTRSRR